MKKEIKLRNEVVAAKFTQMMQRFGYTTNTQFIEDMLYFFETNPVSPKDKFDNLFKGLNDKIDEFHKDNNRVIAVLRNIEKVKIDTIYRLLTTDITTDLTFIKKKFLLNEVLVPDSNTDKKTVEKEPENPQILSENNVDKLTESYEKKLKSERERYKMLQIEYDKVTLEHGTFYNRLKKLNTLFTVEKSTFGKSKIVFEMTEEEFKELIKLK